MPVYKFGNSIDKYECVWECTAKNLEFAIKLFKISVLFPEQYVDKKFFKKGYDWDSEMHTYIPKADLTNAYIPVYLYNEKLERANYDKWRESKDKKAKLIRWSDAKPLCTLSLQDCINVDYNQLTDTKFLPSPESSGNLPAEITSNASLMEAVTHKLKARQWMTEVSKMREELTRKKDELYDQIQGFEKIIEGKRKTLFAIETYLGLHEDVVQLKQGASASEEEPISIYQMKLYMDEEVGLTEVDGYEFYEGLDWQSIEKFDKWISKHYKKFLYKPKSIMAWEVRRHDRNYDENKLINGILNAENHRTYFLIRNGDNLYRIDSNVYTPGKMFPSQDEFAEILKDKREDDAKDYIEKRMYIFIALQGLVDRSPILGTNFQGKIDFIHPSNFNEKYINLIRDAEMDFIIGDGRPSWDEYTKENRNTIKEGCRCFLQLDHYHDHKYIVARISGGSRWSKIPPDGVYIIEEDMTDDYNGSGFKIRYSSDEEIYAKKSWMHSWEGEFRKRKKRLGFKAHKSELLNIDEITYSDIDYYIHNRLYRQSYIDVLSMMKKIYMWKKEEFTKEKPFIDLLADKFDWENKNEIQKMTSYWKTKNKWMRFLSTDEPKAFRMIGKYIEKAKKKEDWKTGRPSLTKGDIDNIGDTK
jgi:hypothetical protein